MTETYDNFLWSVTDDYINSVDKTKPIVAKTIQSELITRIITGSELHNSQLTKGQKRWPVPHQLNNTQIALIMAEFYPIKRVVCSDTFAAPEDQDMLAMYQYSGAEEGLYVESPSAIHKLALSYNMELKKNDLDDIDRKLRDLVPRVLRCNDPDLFAVNNGIIDYSKKKLMKFSPEYVFTSKAHAPYNPKAKNPVITMSDGTDWDVESWINDLFDDPDLANLIWQVIGATLRPNVAWNHNAWFYSTVGNNGKGTLCQLIRNLLGESAHCSLSIEDFSHDFALEPLLHVSAIITDENNVGTYIDKVANFKAVCTNDSIRIDRKFKNSITYKFRGFMIQCINDLPKIKDKTESFYRRQLIIPFAKTFTGREKTEIKNDFLKRPDVLEYVLYKIVNSNYYSFDIPDACISLLDEYKVVNDPVREFVTDIFPALVWDIYPSSMIYDIYKKWRQANNAEGKDISKSKFEFQLKALLNEPSFGWTFNDKTNAVYIHDAKWDQPELLIVKYNLTDYMNSMYSGNVAEKKAICDTISNRQRKYIERNKA